MAVDIRRSSQARRLRLILAAVMVLLGGITLRLVQIQVVEAKSLSKDAMRQWRRAIEVPARRGTIYDRDGEPLALSVEAYDIYATPYQVTDVTSTAATLAAVLGETPEHWRSKLSKGGGFAWLERRVDTVRANALKEHRLPGIGFIDSSRRSYRIAPVAAQVIGIVGVDGGGLAGLELFYDDVLAGRPGVLEADRDPMGRTLPGRVVRSEAPVDGQAIRITLDSDIQYKARTELYAAVKEWGAKGGMIMVMDPATGEILAAAAAPGVDPARLTPKTMRGLKNRLVTDVMEPGSTMKVVTVAAALEEREVKPWTRFVLGPTIHVGGHTVHEAHDRPTVDYSVSEILAHSSNVGAVTLGLKLGKERLHRYVTRFGLTEPAGVDFPGETTGWVPQTKDWSRTSIATIPFGQGISATPLQMMRVFATVANDGVAVTPHFLASEVGTVSPALTSRRVVSTSTARQVRAMLALAVADGTGASAQIPGYSVGGKTGTAQKPREGARGYAPGAYVASFVGFAPAGRPRLACLVVLDEPSDAIYGGVVAAPVFARVMRFALAHLKVPPDKPGARTGADTPAAEDATPSVGAAGSGDDTSGARGYGGRP